MINKFKKVFLLLLAVAIVAVAIAIFKKNQRTSFPAGSNQTLSSPALSPSSPNSDSRAFGFNIPISNANTRITKKPFGIYISPGHSPISPERFSGYHTGADFEITNDELSQDVNVSAICDGKIIQKRSAQGYGGIIIEDCQSNGKDLKIIYGHISLAKSPANANQAVKKGDAIAVLGQAYSAETRGERKHLHLGIYQGQGLDIRGYVQNESQLVGWMDPEIFLGFK